MKKGLNTKIRWLILILLSYLALKFIINPEPVVYVRDGKIGIGLFNFYKRPEVSAINYDFALKPFILISPYETDLNIKKAIPPFSASENGILHIMGTDHLGRDVFAGFVCGLELAILISFFVALLTGLITMMLGGVGAYFERYPLKTNLLRLFFLVSIALIFTLMFSWYLMEIIELLPFLIVLILLFTAVIFLIKLPYKRADLKYEIPVSTFNRRIQEFFQPIPDLILLMLFVAIFDQMGLVGLIILLIILRIPSGAYFLQGIASQQVSSVHVDQARSMGLPDSRILFRHIYPLMLPGTSVFMLLNASRAVLSESALSFLGIGPTSNYMSWGVMIKLGLTNLQMWWVSFFPIVGLVGISLIYQKMVGGRN